MRTTSVILFIFAIIIGANYYASSQTKKPGAKTAKGTSKAASSAEIEEGKNLIAKSDCLACHQLQAKAVGPAYSAVAAKYKATDANVSRLADKVIKGGAGVWGQVPMTPHPAIAAADARKMVRYVLSVK